MLKGTEVVEIGIAFGWLSCIVERIVFVPKRNCRYVCCVRSTRFQGSGDDGELAGIDTVNVGTVKTIDTSDNAVSYSVLVSPCECKNLADAFILRRQASFCKQASED